MIRLKEYTVDEVFTAIETAGRSAAFLPDGTKFRKNSARIQLFHTKGVTCVTCGREGNLFSLETQSEDVPPHLNLYAVEDGKYILMTKDHIHPKSKGGANALHNYQTMCAPCNGEKADKL